MQSVSELNVTRETFVRVLEEIVLLLELGGENRFKINAYRNGAEVVRNFPGEIVSLAREGKLKGVKGLGDALQSKLQELATTGELNFLKELKKQFPESLYTLFELQGLGAKKVRVLYESLGIDSVEALKKACEDGTVAQLSGFGKKTVENLLKAIVAREAYAGLFCHASLAGLAEVFLERLRSHEGVLQASLCGSFRRGKEVSHDLDFLVSTTSPQDLTSYFTRFPEVISVLACGETKASVLATNQGIQCDLRAVSQAQFPFAQQYFTGSKEHNVAVRTRAKRYGFSLNEYGFTPLREGVTLPAVQEEQDLYRALELDYIPPELREDRGELALAEAGKLPTLVELMNLRGVFHVHTTASDGTGTLEEMVRAVADLGLQYVGISDHSRSSVQANGLSEERLIAQMEEIRVLNQVLRNEQVGVHVFSGSEVDILKNGALDYEDVLLEQLDFCIASVHQPLNMSASTMTQRVIRAMENPHVTMLGHATGRLLLRREPYPIQIEKIIDCAAETGTIIELNCSSLRADLDWRWWRLAKEKGVKTSLNPDAHSVAGLQNLSFGVRWARKGGLEKEDIINCLPLPLINAYLQ